MGLSAWHTFLFSASQRRWHYKSHPLLVLSQLLPSYSALGILESLPDSSYGQLGDKHDALVVVRTFLNKVTRSTGSDHTPEKRGTATALQKNPSRSSIARSSNFHNQTLSLNQAAASFHPACCHRGFSSNAGNSTESSSRVQQYLDLVLLKVAAHIEDIPKRAYLRSLENVLKTLPEVEGSVGEILRSIEERFQETVKKRQDLAKDARGASHLQLACLVLASYRSLLPYFAHKHHVTVDVIREPVGAAAAGTVDLISRFALFLSFDKFSHVSRKLDYLGRDFARSFDITQQKEPGYHSLKVTRCLYNTFFELEGESELTRLFCAFDKMWFDHVSPRKHGIKFSRPTTLADGAPLCDFVLRRKTP